MNRKLITGVMRRFSLLFSVTVLSILVSACASSVPTATPTFTTVPATSTETVTPSPVPSDTPTETLTPTPSETPTPTVTPTYVSSLRAKVNVEGRLTCRFGPGEPYLYKFTFAGGANIEVVGRMEYSHWVLAQAIGGSNRCWVNGNFLEFKGDPMALKPMDPHVVMPFSTFYGPMSNVSAARNGNLVTVSYGGLVLVPSRGDDSEQTPYVLEAWVCQGGEFVFIAVGSYTYAAEVVDEGGCGGRSHGRVAAAEKHGYTAFVEVPWPVLNPN